MNGIVYSTGMGRMCPQCSQPVASCRCKEDAKKAPGGNGIVRVGRETAGRKGSGVTVVSGLPLSNEALQDLARKLKARCGSGGTVKNGILEIQGDHRDTILTELIKLGYPAKKSGG